MIDDDLERKFLTNPMGLTEPEREQLELRHGRDNYLRRFQERVSQQLRGFRCVPPYKLPRK